MRVIWVKHGRYDRNVRYFNIFIDTLSLSTEKRLVTTNCFLTTKSLIIFKAVVK